MSVTLTLGSETIETTSHPDEYRDGESGQSSGLQRELQMIVFDDCSEGIGLKFVGGCSLDGEVSHGIFISRILPGKAAEASGDVMIGDQVVEVNGESLEGVSYRRMEFQDVLAEQEEQKLVAVTDPRQQPTPVGDRGVSSSAERMVSFSSHSSHQTSTLQAASSQQFPLQEVVHQPDPLSLQELPPRLRSAAAPVSGSHLTGRYPSPLLSHKARLYVEKLEEGQRSLGLDPTPEQHLQLRQHLNISSDGKVPFGEFVKATREVFRGQLKGILSPSGNFPVGSPFHQPWAGGEESVATMRSALETSQEELCLEIQRLQHLLFDKERAQKRSEDEIRRLHQEVQAMAQECQPLHIKLFTAEMALKSARNLEQDYDDVIELLENEIVQLRSNHTKSLKKSEGAKRRGDVALEKLFNYVEQVQEVLAEVTGAAPPKSMGKKTEGAGSQQPKPTKKQMLQALADTGQAVIKSVKANLETVQPQRRSSQGIQLMRRALR